VAKLILEQAERRRGEPAAHAVLDIKAMGHSQ
jgi:hypothetical protein